MSYSSERVLVVRNVASSRASEVQRNVINQLEEDIPKKRLVIFQTPSANNEETIEALSEVILPGDRILVAGGDGTGNAVINAYMQANNDGAQVGFLPYGNFNDMAATFTGHRAQRDPFQILDASRAIDVNPLEVIKNGEHFRYALLYATLGWTALAAAIFDDPKEREALQSGKANLFDSLMRVARMYFKTRSSSSLPAFYREEKSQTYDNLTDVIAINGPIMAKIIRSKRKYYEGEDFLSSELNVASLLANRRLLGNSALNMLVLARLRLPGRLVSKDELHFLEDVPIPIQLDGEFSQLENVNTLAISKEKETDKKTIKVMKTTR